MTARELEAQIRNKSFGLVWTRVGVQVIGNSNANVWSQIRLWVRWRVGYKVELQAWRRLWNQIFGQCWSGQLRGHILTQVFDRTVTHDWDCVLEQIQAQLKEAR
jgi:hypothetical protein